MVHFGCNPSPPLAWRKGSPLEICYTSSTKKQANNEYNYCSFQKKAQSHACPLSTGASQHGLLSKHCHSYILLGRTSSLSHASHLELEPANHVQGSVLAMDAQGETMNCKESADTWLWGAAPTPPFQHHPHPPPVPARISSRCWNTGWPDEREEHQIYHHSQKPSSMCGICWFSFHSKEREDFALIVLLVHV